MEFVWTFSSNKECILLLGRKDLLIPKEVWPEYYKTEKGKILTNKKETILFNRNMHVFFLLIPLIISLTPQISLGTLKGPDP